MESFQQFAFGHMNMFSAYIECADLTDLGISCMFYIGFCCRNLHSMWTTKIKYVILLYDFVLITSDCLLLNRSQSCTQAQGKLMTWHSRNRSMDGKMRMVPDSPQWRFVDSTWPDFAADPRNIRLGLAADGVNPFAEKRSNWSTWPISLINYNLPPWLATKKHFLILALIIPGPESVTAENVDTFLEPLVDELMELWQNGIETVDASEYGGSRVFNMKAMLIMTIHDLEAYSMLNGCMVKGKHGCPICGPNCLSRYSFTLGKNVYNAQYRRWLPIGHPYRENAEAFDGSVEERAPPTKVTAADTMRWAEERRRWLEAGGAPARDDPALRTGVKRLPILFRLPYWKVHWVLGKFSINMLYYLILISTFLY